MKDTTIINLDDVMEEIIAWVSNDRVDENLEPLNLNMDTQLLDEGIFDSLKILQFVAWLEENYTINIGIENLTVDFFATPKSIAAQVLLLIKANQIG